MTTAVVATVLALLVAVAVISVFSSADEATPEPDETRLGDLLEP